MTDQPEFDEFTYSGSTEWSPELTEHLRAITRAINAVPDKDKALVLISTVTNFCLAADDPMAAARWLTDSLLAYLPTAIREAAPFKRAASRPN